MSILYSNTMSSTHLQNGKLNHSSLGYNYDGKDLNIRTNDNGNVHHYDLTNDDLMKLLAVRPSPKSLQSRISELAPSTGAGTKKRKRKYKKMTKGRK